MITNNNDRLSLIKYRLQQAHDIINEVQFLIDNQKLSNASNRIYYGIFYTVTALALLYKFETSKHLQLIGWFHKTFIKENIFDKNLGKILKETFENRQKSDYEPYITITVSDINDLYDKMKDFIAVIEKHIRDNQDKIMDN